MTEPFNTKKGIFDGFFNVAGLHTNDIIRLKELSTCDKCKQAVNTYVMIWPVQMQVCERCYSHIHKWGPSILKRLLGYNTRTEI